MARALIDGQPLDADGAARHALFRFVHRPIKEGGDVGTWTPGVGDGHVHFATAFFDIDFLQEMKARAENRDEGFAAELGRDAELGGVAGFVAVLVERDVELLGAVDGIAGRIPAGIEDDARCWSARIVRCNIETVTTPADGLRNSRRRVGSDRQRAAADLALHGDGFIRPRAVAAIPLPIGVETRQRPRQIVGRFGFVVGSEQHDVEARVLIFRSCEILEQRLDADALKLQVDGQRQVAFDRASTCLAQLDADCGFERFRRARQLRERDGDCGFAVVVHREIGRQRLAHRIDRLVRLSEDVASEACHILVRRLHDDFAFKAEACGRRAVEIMAVGADRLVFVGRQRGHVG